MDRDEPFAVDVTVTTTATSLKDLLDAAASGSPDHTGFAQIGSIELAAADGVTPFLVSVDGGTDFATVPPGMTFRYDRSNTTRDGVDIPAAGKLTRLFLDIASGTTTVAVVIRGYWN